VPLADPGGANSTATVHLPFGASTWPEHPSLAIVNEPGSGAPSAAVFSVTGTVLEFDSSMFLALPVTPASTAVNDSDFGAFSVTATPSPSRATVGPVPL
jgi:hypothetical protein